MGNNNANRVKGTRCSSGGGNQIASRDLTKSNECVGGDSDVAADDDDDDDDDDVDVAAPTGLCSGASDAGSIAVLLFDTILSFDAMGSVDSTDVVTPHRITGTTFALLTTRIKASNEILTPKSVVLSDVDEDEADDDG